MLNTDSANNGKLPPLLPQDQRGETESTAAFHRSRTYLARLPDPAVYLLRLSMLIGVLALFYIVIPLLTAGHVIADYKLNLIGKYLSLALVALGIDLIWGYTGLLSLFQAVFFCMGGYIMAMHLSLPQGGGDVRPEYNNIPQFMFFNNVHELPLFWRPFVSLPLTILLGLAIPAVAASVFGFFLFRSRVRGVSFSIVTQAVALGAWLLLSRNEMLLGGTNGLTNFNKSLTEQHGYVISLYLLTVTMVVIAYLICYFLVKSRLGRVLVAIRDKETRLYFAGYRPYAFKVFAFAVAAMLAAMGGMLYSPQVTIISPHNMKVEQSILMVIWVALGGRGRLWGAVFGAMLVNYLYSSLTSDMPSQWPYILGGTCVVVVLFFPDGIVGVWDRLEQQVKQRTNISRLILTALPIAVLSVVVLFEATGLYPQWMQNHTLLHIPLGMKAKYWMIVITLVACIISELVHARARAAPESAAGFTIGPPSATPTGGTP